MKSPKDLVRWYFSREAMPYWSILLVDCFFVMVSGFLAYMINHGVSAMLDGFASLAGTLAVFLLCFLIGFRIFHTYVGVIRYSSFSDLTRVTAAVLLAVALVILLQFALVPSDLMMRFGMPDIILFGLLVITFLWVSRVWVKTLFESFIHHKPRTPVYIFGVKAGGVAIAKNLNSAENSDYKVAGFVTEEPDMENRRLLGVHVWPFDNRLLERMRDANVDTLIVSPLKMNFLRERREFIESLADAGIKILVFSGAQKWDLHSDFRVRDLRPVDVEDLLPRQKIDVDMKAAADLLSGKTVMITGAAGSIGSEMVRQIAAYRPSRMLLIDQAETPMHDVRLEMRDSWPDIQSDTIVADITDADMMEHLFSETRPDYVFHAAAYKHVPMMEDNPYESIIDKAVNPTNVMGCSKRICEIYVQSLDKAVKDGIVKGRTQFVTTRFGNVLGSNGSVIPLFQKQIREGGPVTVTHPDIIRFFMLIPEACKLVIEAGTMGNGGEIYVFDMGEPVKIADLARRMIRLSGAKDVEIVFTGLRDGEKLYEEVLNDQEVTLPTFHPKIKVAKVREYEFSDVEDKIADLVATCETYDDMKMVARMKSIVPEYKSQHSRYECLDVK